MRYLPLTKKEHLMMLEKIGIDSVEDLFDSIPISSKLKSKLNLKAPMSESELLDYMENLSFKNKTFNNTKSFIGAGSYNHYIPTAINHMLLRSEFYTAYTPYQPEISQGTLQAIYEFQTLISQLFDMDVTNASMYDGATSMTEAILMAKRVYKKGSKTLISSLVHPEYRDTATTYLGREEFKVLPQKEGVTDLDILEESLDKETTAVIIQYPNFFGNIEDLETVRTLINEKAPKAMMIVVVAEPLALGALTAPGSFGADIVVGEGQSLGIPTSFGGPGIGLFSCKAKHLRKMPGRLVGQTVDLDGKRSFVLTLSTREQHIRREKATSNICSNHSLNAVAVSIYLSLLGKEGIKEVSLANIYNTQYAIKMISQFENIELKYGKKVFNEFIIEVKDIDSTLLYEKLKERDVLLGLPLKRYYPKETDSFLLNFTENTSAKTIDKFVQILIEVIGEL